MTTKRESENTTIAYFEIKVLHCRRRSRAAVSLVQVQGMFCNSTQNSECYQQAICTLLSLSLVVTPRECDRIPQTSEVLCIHGHLQEVRSNLKDGETTIRSAAPHCVCSTALAACTSYDGMGSVPPVNSTRTLDRRSAGDCTHASIELLRAAGASGSACPWRSPIWPCAGTARNIVEVATALKAGGVAYFSG